jgi:nitrate/TMAO reductase-like tetraheme cytochrome c subunit
MRRWEFAIVAALLAIAGPPGLQAQVVTCEKCHANRDFLGGRPGRAGDTVLYVPPSILADTRHRGLACADCHRGYEAGYPHGAAAKVAGCESCHEAAGRDWQASIHAPNAAASGDAPTCVGCHGSHSVYGKDDRRSPTHPLNVAATCGRCHADPGLIGTYFSTADKAQARVAVAQFHKTVHGTALTREGLVVSATCNDCHGAHKVLPADSSASSVSRHNIPATCGACHVGITEVYDRSAHGRAYAAGDTTESGRPAPVCVDCHSAHEIVRADQPEWFLGVVRECGSCHERLYETYFETYHGKVTHLGSALAAACSDCHTPHDMRPATDPQSSVYVTNLVATCGRCHPGANANFTRYAAHGDPRDRASYPVLYWTWLFMTVLLVSVMTFFLLHTFLWLTRVTVERMRGGRPKHGGAAAGAGTGS